MKWKFVLAAAVVLACSLAWVVKKIPDAATLEVNKIELGRQLFFDKSLSHPNGEACSVCHSPRSAFSDPFHAVISEGILENAFVIRNSPSLTYDKYIPPLTWSEKEQVWKGGLFWDGRSNSLEHQLSGPFFNPAEMNNPDTATLVADLPKAEYYKLFKTTYGKPRDNKAAYEAIIDALAHFERSEYLHTFSSKFDEVQRGNAQFSEDEHKGYELFQGKANCSKCHSITPNADGVILFTDYSFHNLGVPRNESNPYYTTLETINPVGAKAIDLGLGPVVKDARQNGKFRTPSLRNVAETAPYFHNGGFASLSEALDFVLEHHRHPEWNPEVRENVEDKYTGYVELNETEKAEILAFLYTLTDQ